MYEVGAESGEVEEMGAEKPVGRRAGGGVICSSYLRLLLAVSVPDEY